MPPSTWQAAFKDMMETQQRFYQQVIAQDAPIPPMMGTIDGAASASAMDDVISVAGSVADSVSSFSPSDAPNPFQSVLPDSDVLPSIRNSRFYFEDNLCRLMVGDEVFQIHRQLLQGLSAEAKNIITVEGKAHDDIVRLDGITASDFEALLSVLYCRIWEQPPLSTKDEWTSVLKVAHLLACLPLKDMAVNRLRALTTSIDKIVLSRSYAIKDWVEDSYIQIAEAKTLPSLDDCRRLGLDTLYELSRAREAMTCSDGVIWSAVERRSQILSFFADTNATHKSSDCAVPIEPDVAGIPIEEGFVTPGVPTLEVLPSPSRGANIGPTPEPNPEPPTSLVDLQGGGWLGGSVDKKVGGGVSNAWGADSQEKDVLISAAGFASAPRAPNPVTRTGTGEPEDRWFSPASRKRVAKKAAGAAVSTVSALPPATNPSPEPAMDDWFSAAKNRKNKKSATPENFASTVTIVDDMIVPPAPPAEEDDWFSGRSGTKKGIVSMVAGDPPLPVPEPAEPKEESTSTPTSAAVDDWFAPAAKKKAKKGMK